MTDRQDRTHAELGRALTQLGERIDHLAQCAAAGDERQTRELRGLVQAVREKQEQVRRFLQHTPETDQALRSAEEKIIELRDVLSRVESRMGIGA